MSDVNASAPPSKAEEMRERKRRTAAQKFDRLANDAITALDELLSHTRDTAGILNEEQAGVLESAVSDRLAALRGALKTHTEAPVKVKGKEAKKKAFSLF